MSKPGPLTRTDIADRGIIDLIKLARKELDGSSPRFAKGLVALTWRLLQSVVSLVSANSYLLDRYRMAKHENAILHRTLAALIAQNGGDLRLDEATWKATPADRRIGGYVEADNESVTVYRLLDEPLLENATWPVLPAAMDGHYVPNDEIDVMKREPHLLPIFNAKQFVLPTRKALS